jgi:hypothetical protein
VTYPPSLYHGDDGEISATHRPGDAAPELVYPNGTRMHLLSTGASTGGLFGLYRWECGPDVTGPGRLLGGAGRIHPDQEQNRPTG